jgi:hypothetical protein
MDNNFIFLSCCLGTEEWKSRKGEKIKKGMKFFKFYIFFQISKGFKNKILHNILK